MRHSHKFTCYCIGKDCYTALVRKYSTVHDWDVRDLRAALLHVTCRVCNKSSAKTLLWFKWFEKYWRRNSDHAKRLVPRRTRSATR